MIRKMTPSNTIPPNEIPRLRPHALRGRARLGMCKLHARVRRDHVGDSRGDEKQGLAVIPAAHQRDGFALKTAHLTVRQDWF